MVDVRESYQSGNRLIVIHNNDDEDGPSVYTPDEAEEIKDQLDDIL